MSRLFELRRWVADLLTLSNGLFGFLSIATWAVELGPLSNVADEYVAAAYIGLGMVADGLDGIVARWWGSTGLGNALDSMADCITFCVAPAVFLLEANDAAPGSTLAAATAVVALLFITAGMLRLARQRDLESEGTFVGLPTPWSGATLVLLLLLPTPPWVALGAAIVLAALNVSRLRYPKTRGAWTGVVVAILLVAILVIASLVVSEDRSPTLLVVGGFIAAAMVVLGPVFAAAADRRAQR